MIGEKFLARRLDVIKARVRGIEKLPLADRDAIPHEEFMKLTKEFLDLIGEWKRLDGESKIPPTS